MKNQLLLFILLLAFVSGFLACNTANPHTANEANIRKAYEALSKKDFESFAALCADNYTELSLGPQPIQGVKNALEQYKMFFNAFPDFKAEVTDIAPVNKNKYFLKVHLTGTNTGSFMNLPPTAKFIDIWDMDIVELNDDGKCTSHWVAYPGAVLDAIGYGSVMKPATAVVMAAYDAFGRKDNAAILKLCSDDAIFEVHDQALDPKSPRLYKGHAEITKFFDELNTKITHSRFVPTRFLTDGDDVAVIVSVDYKLNATAINYTANYNHHFRVVNGKIVSFKGVSDMANTIKN